MTASKIPPVREWGLDEWLIALLGGLIGVELVLLGGPVRPWWAGFGSVPVVIVAGVLLVRFRRAGR